MLEPAVTKPSEKRSGYPALSSAGSISEPSATTVIPEAPVKAVISANRPSPRIASPPGIHPNMARVRSTSRSGVFECDSSTPAKVNSGSATRTGSSPMRWNSITTRVMFRPCSLNATSAPSAMTANSGMPSSANSASTIKSISACPRARRVKRQRVAHEPPAHQRESNRNDHQHPPARHGEKRQVVHGHLELDQADAGRRQHHTDQRGQQVHRALHPRLYFFGQPVQQHVDLYVARLPGGQHAGQHGDPEYAGAHRVVGPDQRAVGEIAQPDLGEPDDDNGDEDRAEQPDFQIADQPGRSGGRGTLVATRRHGVGTTHWASVRISSSLARRRSMPGTWNAPDASISSSTWFEIRCHSRTSSCSGSTISMPCSSSASRASWFSSTVRASCSCRALRKIASQIARCSGEIRSNALRSTAITPAVISTGRSSMYFARVCHCRMMAPDMVLAKVLMVPVCSAV